VFIFGLFKPLKKREECKSLEKTSFDFTLKAVYNAESLVWGWK
jgi:hypothetical protein